MKVRALIDRFFRPLSGKLDDEPDGGTLKPGDLRVRRNAYGSFKPGTMFRDSDGLWVLERVEPGTEESAHDLFLRKMPYEDELAWEVMLS